MIAQMIEIQEYKFTISISNALTYSEPGRQIEFRLYFHPVGYLSTSCMKLNFSTIFFLAGHQSFSRMPRTVWWKTFIKAYFRQNTDGTTWEDKTSILSTMRSGNLASWLVTK